MTVDSFGGILEGIHDKRSKLLSGKGDPCMLLMNQS